MPHSHLAYDTDPHFIIDSESREITYSGTDPLILIQNDHNSERYTFEIPRLVDGHDMSLCNSVQIHYINIDSENGRRGSGVYEVDDLQVSPDSEDIVVCGWPISQNATQFVGSLSFAIRFACLTNTEIDYVWNTAAYSGVKVSSGIYNGEEIEEQYTDIIQSWYDQLFNKENERIESENERKENENQRIAVSEAMETGLTNLVETQRRLLSGQSPFRGALSLLDVYPVGSIYMSINDVDPSVLFGGTWERLKDRFLLGAGDTYSAGEMGGSADAVLINHTHEIIGPSGNPIFLQTNQSGTTGGFRLTVNKASDGSLYSNDNDMQGQIYSSSAKNIADSSTPGKGTGKNMPPYLAVYMWKRTA